MNECEAQRCSQECANIYGTYQCYCRQGYQLAEDGHTCTGTALCPALPEGHPSRRGQRGGGLWPPVRVESRPGTWAEAA